VEGGGLGGREGPWPQAVKGGKTSKEEGSFV